QAVGQEFNGHGPALKAVVGGCPQVGTVEVGGGQPKIPLLLAAVEERVAVLLVERSQGGEQMENIATDTPHLVSRQAAVNSNMHGLALWLSAATVTSWFMVFRTDFGPSASQWPLLLAAGVA